MISKTQYMKLWWFGVFAGVLTTYMLKYLVRPILDFLGGFMPELSLKLAESNPVISVNIRESLTGLNGGMSGWLVDALGLTVTIPMQTVVMGAIGGGMLFVAGAWAADTLGMLKGNAMMKTKMTIFFGNIIAGIVIGGLVVPEIGITMVNTLIAFLINAAILAYGYTLLVKDYLPF